jgi:putative membrane protein insertion efficiency factor
LPSPSFSCNTRSCNIKAPFEDKFLDTSLGKSSAGKLSSVRKAPVMLARGLIQVYRHSLSGLIGRQCRYLPTCSAYMDDALARHGLWAGGWLGLSRLCRCHPWGDSGYDPVPGLLPAAANALHPWRYGAWRRKPVCEAVDQS